jgi:DNA polymerase V
MQPLFGIIDCNNFYVSCERVFQPELEGRPVIVLSNNDGNIIARSNEAKALGITMGAPLFKIQKLIEKHRVRWFSSNYTLYGDMSRRVMDTISQFAPEVETYSIDEAFIHLPYGNYQENAYQIRNTVRRWTGIPVSIGIAPTKTLAKVANNLAKNGKGIIDLSGVDRDKFLKDFDIGDLWGIGQQYAKFLKAEDSGSGEQPDLWEANGLDRVRRKQKIETAYELMQCSDDFIRKHLTIQGLRLVWELRGISCLPLEVFEKPRKGICCSRSFGRAVLTLPELGESVAMHAAKGAEKLRKRHLAASHLTVFISTSQFRQNPDEIYSGSVSFQLPFPTSNTSALTQAATALVERIFKPGFAYRKAGIFLTDIVSDTQRQQNLLVAFEKERHARLMNAIDKINWRHGNHTVRPLSMGFEQLGNLKRANVSGRFTTRLDELARARAI